MGVNLAMPLRRREAKGPQPDGGYADSADGGGPHVTGRREPTRRDGLTEAEVAAQRVRVGPNEMPPPERVPAWRKLVAQFVHFFALMLWAAGVLAILGGLPELGGAIFVVIVINGVFAFVQEHRADRAAERLRDLLPQSVTVIRNGVPTTILATEVVPDDLVVLAEGNRVSADLECVESHGLSVDVSTLTGESVPDSVAVGDTLYAGSFLVEGQGLAVVSATGSRTRLAQIAVLTESTDRPDTPLTRELHRLVRTVAAIAVGVGATFFGLTALLDTPASDGFIFAIGITVALVPEGLLPTVTLSLAIGAQQMADQHALVRRLESVETLGSTTFICTDKTGTITQNRMSVAQVWTSEGLVRIDGSGYEPAATVEADGPAARRVAADAAITALACSTGRAVENSGVWVAHGDPMEAAIDALTRRLGLDAGMPEAAITNKFPFDPHRRRASVVTDTEVLVKGAPDSVFERCDALDPSAPAALAAMAERGLRVLTVAAAGPRPERVPTTADEAEHGLKLLALLGFQDPPRPEARGAIDARRAAGIGVAMITGDDPRTARAIAEQVDLRTSDAPVLSGTDLPDDDQLLGALIDRDGVVIARVSPEQKLRIAKALRARGHVVAMTGDGVNDGPALREADIGVAMGLTGSDVAREAADLVLLDDNFATIVAAVRQGRATFENARRFLTYHLTDNVAELTPFAIWALSGGRFPLALGVLQVLALDIGTDTLSAAALGAEPATEGVMAQPPSSGRLLNRTTAIRAFTVAGPTEAVFEMGAFIVGLMAAGWRPGDPFPTGIQLAAASGAAFLTVVVAQSANAFACRSLTRPAWRLGWFTNRFLLAAVVVEVCLAGLFIAVPALANFVGQRLPPAATWPVILLSAPAVLVADAMWKRRAVRGPVREGSELPPEHEKQS